MNAFWSRILGIAGSGAATLAALAATQQVNSWGELFTPHNVASAVLVLAGVGAAGVVKSPLGTSPSDHPASPPLGNAQK